jgi:hypothetical protein
MITLGFILHKRAAAPIPTLTTAVISVSDNFSSD